MNFIWFYLLKAIYARESATGKLRELLVGLGDLSHLPGLREEYETQREVWIVFVLFELEFRIDFCMYLTMHNVGSLETAEKCLGNKH